MSGFLKKGDLYLAPMSGHTDAAFRRLAREFGADICVSEFVHARAALSKAPKILEKLKVEDFERPCGIQLFGGDEFEMADAASFVEEAFAPDFIDINYGCPAPNAVDAGAGASLLKDPAKMAKIAERTKLALKKTPLTAKMRTGWGSQTILPGAALRLQDAGVEVLALHGRSKVQGYAGDADWNLIEKTAQALDIPLVGNGSVEKLSAQQLKGSACSAFMVGRAAIGNPWIFAEIKARLSGGIFTAPTPAERISAAKKYMAYSMQSRSECAIKFIRANLIAFMREAAGFKKIRLFIANAKSLDDIYRVFDEYE